MKKFDVVALGELLIDFTEAGVSAQGNTLFEVHPGGAPCNVLAMLRKLGKSCAFVGKVGNDMFGRYLRQVALDAGIYVGGLVMDEEVQTTLTFVKAFENGERDVSFYRNPGADMMLIEADLPLNLIQSSKIFHFGSLSMTNIGIRKATRKAVQLAKNSGSIISFDPNLRPSLWKNIELAKEQIQWGLQQCDVLKLSDHELMFMTDTADVDEGADGLMSKYPNIKILSLTAGANGSYSYQKDTKVFAPSYKLSDTDETAGAGDAFCGCVLNYLLEHGLKLTIDQRKEMLAFANVAAYLAAAKKGAICSMPEKEEIAPLL